MLLKVRVDPNRAEVPEAAAGIEEALAEQHLAQPQLFGAQSPATSSARPKVVRLEPTPHPIRPLVVSSDTRPSDSIPRPAAASSRAARNDTPATTETLESTARQRAAIAGWLRAASTATVQLSATAAPESPARTEPTPPTRGPSQ